MVVIAMYKHRIVLENGAGENDHNVPTVVFLP